MNCAQTVLRLHLGCTREAGISYYLPIAIGNILTTTNPKMATIDITMPEVKLFSLTGHNSPSNTMGITWKPIEWKSIKQLEVMTRIGVPTDISNS